MQQAIDKANELEVPLVIAGDLHDTKANLRGECVNELIVLFKQCNSTPFLLIGNHCKLNEKSERHSLEFLRPYATIVEVSQFTNDIVCNGKSVWLIPYQHDVTRWPSILRKIDPGSTVIMHQGIKESSQTNLIDPTAITKKDVAGLRIISGHYHRRETITIPLRGIWDFVGNPYTLGFGEAADPEKGFQVLYSDSSLEFVPTNLRKHIKINIKVGDIDHPDLWQYNYKKGDLLWVQVSGDKGHLIQLTKAQIAQAMEIDEDFRLDLIPTDGNVAISNVTRSGAELLDAVIDDANYSPERKQKLKELWRRLRG